MLTQPPFKYTQGTRAGQLVTNTFPWNDWRHFILEVDAQKMLQLVRELAPGAMMMSGDGYEGGYAPSGDPNPGNAHVFIIHGYVPDPKNPENVQEILEFAGDIWERMTAPQTGLDDYPLKPGGAVQLVYSPSEQGLIWKAAA